MIAHIKRWLNRKFREVNFYLTQMITGLLKEASKHTSTGSMAANSAYCLSCPRRRRASFFCFFALRFIEKIHVAIHPGSTISAMIASGPSWRATSIFVEELRAKEGEA